MSDENKMRFLPAGLGGMGGLGNACNIVDKTRMDLITIQVQQHFNTQLELKKIDLRTLLFVLQEKLEFLSLLGRILLLFFLKPLIWILKSGVSSI